MPLPVWMGRIRSPGVSVILVLCLSCLVVVTKSEEESRHKGYVVKGRMSDGEEQVLMRFDKVVVRETVITQDGGRKGLLLRQVGSGPHFLQLIYKVNNPTDGSPHRKLVECEVLEDWKAANEFRNRFKKDLLATAGSRLEVPGNKGGHQDEGEGHEEDDAENGIESDETDSDPIDLGLDLTSGLEPLLNVSVRVLGEEEVASSQELGQAFSLRRQKRSCNRLHRRMKQVLNVKRSNSSNSRSIRFRRESEAFRVGIMPGTLWCGDGSLAEELSSLGAHVGADRCCRQHDGCPFLIDAMSSKFGMFNYRMHTISHCNCDESDTRFGRVKRDGDEISAAASFLQGQLPGTEWCGRGFTARELTTLGAYTGADNCCRRHDLGCPFYIEAFTEKFGLFNWRMYTINHCTCDERFRSCLKQTNTGAANFVGKIFFNVVQTKCFLLKPERVCAKLSWFGKCLKHEYKKQAHLRDPMPY